MAVQLVRLPTLEAPGPLNFQPISNALDDFRKNKEFEARQANDEARLDLERQRLGLAQGQAQRSNQQADEEKQKAAIGGVVQSIDNIPATDPARQQAWGKFIASQPHYAETLQKYGQDPTDHINAPKFILGQLQGPISPEQQSQIDYRKAMTAQAQANTSATGVKSGLAIMDAKARLAARGQMSPEEWAQESNPGGLVNVAFGGARIPYEKAPMILAQATKDVNAQFEPTEEDKIAGITREHKIEAFKRARINEMYGVEPKTLYGKSVRLKPDGSFEAIPGSSTQSERQGETIARAALQRLDEGEKILNSSNSFQHFFGDPEGNKFISGYGEAGRGYRDVKAAIIDLNFALSGKSVSNKEREEFLSLYMPRYTDSTATQKQKMKMVRDYFNVVMDMRNHGASDDAVAGVLRDRLKNAPRDEPGGSGARGAPAGGTPKADYRYNPATGKLEALR